MGLIDNAHTSFTQLLEDVIVGYGLTDHGDGIRVSMPERQMGRLEPKGLGMNCIGGKKHTDFDEHCQTCYVSEPAGQKEVES